MSTTTSTVVTVHIFIAGAPEAARDAAVGLQRQMRDRSAVYMSHNCTPQMPPIHPIINNIIS